MVVVVMVMVVMVIGIVIWIIGIVLRLLDVWSSTRVRSGTQPSSFCRFDGAQEGDGIWDGLQQLLV